MNRKSERLSPQNINSFLILMGVITHNPIEVIEEMLDAGVDVNARVVDLGSNTKDFFTEESATISAMDTPLLAAVKYNPNIEIIKTLLKRGADSMVKDEDGKTSLIIAEEKGYYEVLTLLRNYDSNPH